MHAHAVEDNNPYEDTCRSHRGHGGDGVKHDGEGAQAAEDHIGQGHEIAQAANDHPTHTGDHEGRGDEEAHLHGRESHDLLKKNGDHKLGAK